MAFSMMATSRMAASFIAVFFDTAAKKKETPST
jgi:hypothetical protein